MRLSHYGSWEANDPKVIRNLKSLLTFHGDNDTNQIGQYLLHGVNFMAERLFVRVNVDDGFCTMKDDDILLGTIKNISLGGLFVTSDIQLSAMDRVQISITLPGDSRRIEINAEAVVARVENKGIAFKYENLTDENFWTLQTILQGLRCTHFYH